MKARRKQLTCNCSAPWWRYNKQFPHRATSVPDCHMDTDGGAKMGIPRENCECHACDTTRLQYEYLQYPGNFR